MCTITQKKSAEKSKKKKIPSNPSKAFIKATNKTKSKTNKNKAFFNDLSQQYQPKQILPTTTTKNNKIQTKKKTTTSKLQTTYKQNQLTTKPRKHTNKPKTQTIYFQVIIHRKKSIPKKTEIHNKQPTKLKQTSPTGLTQQQRHKKHTNMNIQIHKEGNMSQYKTQHKSKLKQTQDLTQEKIPKMKKHKQTKKDIHKHNMKALRPLIIGEKDKLKLRIFRQRKNPKNPKLYEEEPKHSKPKINLLKNPKPTTNKPIHIKTTTYKISEAQPTGLAQKPKTKALPRPTQIPNTNTPKPVTTKSISHTEKYMPHTYNTTNKTKGTTNHIKTKTITSFQTHQTKKQHNLRKTIEIKNNNLTRPILKHKNRLKNPKTNTKQMINLNNITQKNLIKNTHNLSKQTHTPQKVYET